MDREKAKFRLRPVATFEAEQLTPETWAKVEAWCEGETVRVFVFDEAIDDYHVLRFPAGLEPAIRYEAQMGEWVVQRPDGSFYAMTDEQFRAEFEEA